MSELLTNTERAKSEFEKRHATLKQLSELPLGDADNRVRLIARHELAHRDTLRELNRALNLIRTLESRMNALEWAAEFGSLNARELRMVNPNAKLYEQLFAEAEVYEHAIRRGASGKQLAIDSPPSEEEIEAGEFERFAAAESAA